MTVLTVLQRASSRLGIARPTAVFGATDDTARKLADFALEAAEDIAGAYEWQALKRQQTITGNGETQAFDLPTDYDRIPQDQAVWTSRFETPLRHILSHDEWLEQAVRELTPAYGSWTLLGGQITFYPALNAGETAKFYYMSNLAVMAADMTSKTEFTADTDSFVLSENLLRLNVVWRWKEQHGQAYAESFADYEAELAEEIAKDRGPRAFHVGRGGFPRGVRVSYPRPIG